MKQSVQICTFVALILAMSFGFSSCSSDIDDIHEDLQEQVTKEPLFPLQDFAQVLLDHQLNLQEAERVTDGYVGDSIYYLDHAQLPEWIHKKCHEYFPTQRLLLLSVNTLDGKYYLSICWLLSSTFAPFFFFDEYGNEHQELLFNSNVKYIASALVNRDLSTSQCPDNDSLTYTTE